MTLGCTDVNQHSMDEKDAKSKHKYEKDLTISRIKEDTLESALTSPEKSGIHILDQQQNQSVH